MKKIIRIILILFAFLPFLLHAQDPGTVVGIYIWEEGKIVTGTKMDEYEVAVPRMQKVKTNSLTGMYDAFCWDPYLDQHYAITIKHGGEKMQIEFYVGNMPDFALEPKGFFYNASFRFDVVFIPGKYYKIDKFKKTSGMELLNLEPEPHDWNFWICSTCVD